MIDAKIEIEKGNGARGYYDNLYQSRANIKESIALLLGVEYH